MNFIPYYELNRLGVVGSYVNQVIGNCMIGQFVLFDERPFLKDTPSNFSFSNMTEGQVKSYFEKCKKKYKCEVVIDKLGKFENLSKEQLECMVSHFIPRDCYTIDKRVQKLQFVQRYLRGELSENDTFKVEGVDNWKKIKIDHYENKIKNLEEKLSELRTENDLLKKEISQRNEKKQKINQTIKRINDIKHYMNLMPDINEL